MLEADVIDTTKSVGVVTLYHFIQILWDIQGRTRRRKPSPQEVFATNILINKCFLGPTSFSAYEKYERGVTWSGIACRCSFFFKKIQEPLAKIAKVIRKLVKKKRGLVFANISETNIFRIWKIIVFSTLSTIYLV